MQLTTLLLVGVLSTAANAQQCSEYIVDSDGQDLTFKNYVFSDFRNLAGGSRVQAARLANATTIDERAKIVSQAFFNRSSNIWQKQTWDRPTASRDHPVPMFNDAGNVFIDFDPTTDKDDTMLSLITERGLDGNQIAGEIATQFSALYGSVRFESRVTGDAGACAGLFFYKDDTHEHDFEFLTKDGPDYLQLTNQPGQKNGYPVPGAHSNYTLHNPYNEWQTFRLDWSPGLTRYFVNGVNVINKNTNVSPVAMTWLMNMWSDGSSGWTGKMKVGGKARLDIRYFVMAFNNPDSTDTAKAGVPCRVQNEMDGQGVVSPITSRAEGGSVAARAAQTVGQAMKEGVVY